MGDTDDNNSDIIHHHTKRMIHLSHSAHEQIYEEVCIK